MSMKASEYYLLCLSCNAFDICSNKKSRRFQALSVRVSCSNDNVFRGLTLKFGIYPFLARYFNTCVTGILAGGLTMNPFSFSLKDR
jgi:hypothetical protein